MRVANWGRFSTISALAFILSALSAAVPLPAIFRTTPLATQEVVLALDAEHTQVHWTVDSTLHEVHGTFALKSGSMHFDPVSGKAGGEIIVLARSGQSGNNSRDQRMHREILETAKYPEVHFQPNQIEGKVARSGNSDVKLRGVISVHGSSHEISVPVHVALTGDHWTGTAKFEIPYVEWGIKDPSKWMLKVKPVVAVELEMMGSAKNAE